jgi:hypothetical protein
MKKLAKIFFSLVLMLLTEIAFTQPANDNCASATTLTIDAALSCGQTTQNATLQVGECFTNYGGGSTEYSTWYRITATNDSLILNFIRTNTTNCFPEVSVYGPFASGAGCLPACGSTVYNALQNGDPGSHILLTGLATTGNRDYLIQIQNNDCGGPGSAFVTFCLNVQQPEGNNTPAGADQLNACGTAFSNSTNGGYWQTGTSVGFNNLDGNNATTCSTCPEAGDDTPFIINNVSWTYFCSLVAGTWQVTVSGVSGCTLPSPNQGVQASIFTGTTGALVNAGNSQNPIAPGGSWTSGTITVNAGQCAYLMIDGFAGDACNYSVTLTNLSGGCVVLPIEMISFNALDLDSKIELKWSTASESNNDYFVLEKSFDGENYSFLDVIDGAGSSTVLRSYSYSDSNPFDGTTFYRLRQIDYDGKSTLSGVAKIVRVMPEDFELSIYPNPASSELNPMVILNGKANQKYQLVVTDLLGKQVFQNSLTIQSDIENQVEINTPLVSGIYFITVIDQFNKQLTKKLIVN